MVKKTLTVSLITSVSFILLASACKKAEPVAKHPNCRIVTATFTTGANTSTYLIGYNSEGKPSSITVPNAGTTGGRTIVYNGNTVVSTDMNGMGVVTGSVVVTLNNNNQIINIRENDNASGSSWTNTMIVYDGNGNPLKEIETRSGSNAELTYNYTVSNGNIVAITSNSETITSEYYTNRPSQPGDFWNFISFLNYGTTGYRKSNNLIKSIHFSGITAPVQFVHEMNEKGFISLLRIVSAYNSQSISYEYECD